MSDPSPFRQRIVDFARAEVGVREIGTNIVPYGVRCVRGGNWIRVQGLAWCARFATDITWRAWSIAVRGDRLWTALPGAMLLGWTAKARGNQPPFTMRAAVSEIIRDARECSAWHDVTEAGESMPGDLRCYFRNVDGVEKDPRKGQEGHVAIDIGDGLVVSGNDGDEVRDAPRDKWRLCGWVSVEN